MAKPLEDRQRAALNETARLADVEATIEDTRTALAAAIADAEEQMARAVDPRVPSDDARAARVAAAHAEHDRDRHRNALAALEAKRKALAESQANAAKAVKYNAVLAERDALAEALKTEGAAAISTLVDLNKRLAAQEPVLAAVNASLPEDRPRLDNAECIARGLTSNGLWPEGFSNVFRFANMQLPHFERRGMAWPDEDGVIARQAEAYQEQLQSQRAARLQREAREASRRWYTVQRTDDKHGTLTFHHANGIFGLGYQLWTCELYSDQVERAEAAGMIVTPTAAPAKAAPR